MMVGKVLKRLLTLSLAAGLSVSSCLMAFGAGWQKDASGWWYEEGAGFIRNQWKEIGGKWYYFNQDGYMVCNAWIGNYYVGADGAMLTDTITPDGYKVGSDGAWIQDDGKMMELYNSKIQEIKDSDIDTELTVEFIIQDLNSDGVKELLALGSWWYVKAWTYEDGELTELDIPSNLLKYTMLHEGNILCSADLGHSSHQSYVYYQLNDHYDFEFIGGVEWVNGAYNDEGHDTYYLINSDIEHVKPITEDEFQYILNNY